MPQAFLGPGIYKLVFSAGALFGLAKYQDIKRQKALRNARARGNAREVKVSSSGQPLTLLYGRSGIYPYISYAQLGRRFPSTYSDVTNRLGNLRGKPSKKKYNELMLVEYIMSVGPINKITGALVDEKNIQGELNGYAMLAYDAPFARQFEDVLGQEQTAYQYHINRLTADMTNESKNNLLANERTANSRYDFQSIVTGVYFQDVSSDDPKFGGQVPLPFIFYEGRPVKSIIKDGDNYRLGSVLEFSTNPIKILLDYLICEDAAVNVAENTVEYLYNSTPYGLDIPQGNLRGSFDFERLYVAQELCEQVVLGPGSEIYDAEIPEEVVQQLQPGIDPNDPFKGANPFRGRANIPVDPNNPFKISTFGSYFNLFGYNSAMESGAFPGFTAGQNYSLKRHEYNGSLLTNSTIFEAMDQVLECIPGAILYYTPEGKISVDIPDSSRSAEDQANGHVIDEEFLLDGADFSIIYPDNEQKVNKITVVYQNLEQENIQDTVIFPELGSLLDQHLRFGEDGQVTLPEEFEIEGCNNGKHAKSIASTILFTSRRPTVEFYTNKKGQNYIQGDIVLLKNSLKDYEKYVRIVSRVYDEDLNLKFNAIEFEPQDYVFNVDTNYTPVERNEPTEEEVACVRPGKWRGPWRAGNLYVTDDDCVIKGDSGESFYYHCISEDCHTATDENKPGSGAKWMEHWEGEVIDDTPDPEFDLQTRGFDTAHTIRGDTTFPYDITLPTVKAGTGKEPLTFTISPGSIRGGNARSDIRRLTIGSLPSQAGTTTYTHTVTDADGQRDIVNIAVSARDIPRAPRAAENCRAVYHAGTDVIIYWGGGFGATSFLINVQSADGDKSQNWTAPPNGGARRQHSFTIAADTIDTFFKRGPLGNIIGHTITITPKNDVGNGPPCRTLFSTPEPERPRETVTGGINKNGLLGASFPISPNTPMVTFDIAPLLGSGYSDFSSYKFKVVRRLNKVSRHTRFGSPFQIIPARILPPNPVEKTVFETTNDISERQVTVDMSNQSSTGRKTVGPSPTPLVYFGNVGYDELEYRIITTGIWADGSGESRTHDVPMTYRNTQKSNPPPRPKQPVIPPRTPTPAATSGTMIVGITDAGQMYELNTTSGVLTPFTNSNVFDNISPIGVYAGGGASGNVEKIIAYDADNQYILSWPLVNGQEINRVRNWGDSAISRVRGRNDLLRVEGNEIWYQKGNGDPYQIGSVASVLGDFSIYAKESNDSEWVEFTVLERYSSGDDASRQYRLLTYRNRINRGNQGFLQHNFGTAVSTDKFFSAVIFIGNNHLIMKYNQNEHEMIIIDPSLSFITRRRTVTNNPQNIIALAEMPRPRG